MSSFGKWKIGSEISDGFLIQHLLKENFPRIVFEEPIIFLILPDSYVARLSKKKEENET